LDEILGIVRIVRQPPRKIVKGIKQGHGQLFESCQWLIILRQCIGTSLGNQSD
jgi:hypothetical protein